MSIFSSIINLAIAKPNISGFRITFSIGFLILFLASAQSQEWKQYPYEPAGSDFSFPTDEGPHSEEDIEWWSITGHLKGQETGNNYSFSLTYYIYPYHVYDGMRILNISNDDTGEFYTDSQFLGYQDMEEGSLNIEAYLYFVERWELWNNSEDENGNIIPFEYEITAASSHGSLDLECKSLKAPVPIGGNGHFNVGSESYTNDYSHTLNSISGDFQFKDIQEPVEGTAWIDHQYGGFNMITSEQYEWFSIQLSNDMEINIWNVFTPDNQLPENPDYKHMTIVNASGEHLTTTDFNLDRMAFDYSEDNSRCYAQKWHLVSIEYQLDLTIFTLHNDCEVQTPFRFYKGATYVDALVEGNHYYGEGFAELLKTYVQPKPIMNSPEGTNWDISTPISWHIQNPDDGRTLIYDLEYRADPSEDFQIVESGISDTLYYWDNPPVEVGENIWFRVKGYTNDTTLYAYSPSAFYTPENEDPTVSVDPRTQNASIFKLYPNPAKEVLTIEFQKELDSFQYQILDMSGKVVFQSEKSLSGKGRTLITGHMIPGTYILRVQVDSQVYSKSFQVQQ